MYTKDSKLNEFQYNVYLSKIIIIRHIYDNVMVEITLLLHTMKQNP